MISNDSALRISLLFVRPELFSTSQLAYLRLQSYIIGSRVYSG